MEYKLRKVRMKWFEHVKRRYLDAHVTRCERLNIVGLRRGKERPKKNWRELIRHDIAHVYLTKDVTLDKRLWRSTIRVED